jgi:hypothetical protein
MLGRAVVVAARAARPLEEVLGAAWSARSVGRVAVRALAAAPPPPAAPAAAEDQGERGTGEGEVKKSGASEESATKLDASLEATKLRTEVEDASLIFETAWRNLEDKVGTWERRGEVHGGCGRRGSRARRGRGDWPRAVGGARVE